MWEWVDKEDKNKIKSVGIVHINWSEKKKD